MLSLLISLLVLCVVIAVVWTIFSKIPIPHEFRWVVEIILLVIFAVCLIAVLEGAWVFPVGHWSR
jgi:hypothetical protein